MQRKKRSLLFLIFSVTIFILGALLPGELRESISQLLHLGNVDAYAHVFFGALIALLLAWLGAPVLIVLMAIISLGAVIEVVQIWIPGRSATWSDMAGNVAGALIGLLVLSLGRCVVKRGHNG
ncbi:VanZ family protein [uncultured Alcanivorax sp.]|jgi:VanZ family protein|uniref:VanZ family protein n=1 Tax=uncultured Alcanivorax sp. TaxID=191215 RepID=UPI0025875092|nr:VanZ family protein [uncultured Alcanivorax sp.]